MAKIPEMIPLNHKEFRKLLKQDKNKALEYLMKSKIKKEYYAEVRIEEQKYRIFSTIPEDLFTEKESDELQDSYAAILLQPIRNIKIVKRSDFQYWYFIEGCDFCRSNFSGPADFWFATFSGEAGFREATFSGPAWFAGAIFLGEAGFRGAIFLGEAGFREAIFSGEAGFREATFSTEAAFADVIFSGSTSFLRATFSGNAYFVNSRLKDRCNLSLVGFEKGADFRNLLFTYPIVFDGRKLCKDRYKYSKPTHLILQNDVATRDNLHSVKQIFNKNADYEAENHFYYWYKVYNRKAKKRYIWRPFDWLILDKLTGYFTKPFRVIGTMLLLLTVCFFVYWFACNNPRVLGTLQMENSKGKIVCIAQGTDTTGEYLMKILYFDLITFTTIGYGDIEPEGFLEIVAGIEGLIGVLLISLFLVTAAKKVLW